MATQLLRALPLIDKPMPVQRPDKRLSEAWKRFREAEKHYQAKSWRRKDAQEMERLQQEFEAAEAEYIEAACDVAGVPPILRWVIEANVPDYRTGTIVIIYGDLDPDGELHGRCEVYTNGQVTNWRTPYPDSLPSVREMLSIVR